MMFYLPVSLQQVTATLPAASELHLIVLVLVISLGSRDAGQIWLKLATKREFSGIANVGVI